TTGARASVASYATAASLSTTNALRVSPARNSSFSKWAAVVGGKRSTEIASMTRPFCCKDAQTSCAKVASPGRCAKERHIVLNLSHARNHRPGWGCLLRGAILLCQRCTDLRDQVIFTRELGGQDIITQHLAQCVDRSAIPADQSRAPPCLLLAEDQHQATRTSSLVMKLL